MNTPNHSHPPRTVRRSAPPLVSSLCMLLTVLSLVALLASSPAQAGPGHDHGDAAPAATGTALPRFAAESELFDLVGVLQGAQITLYLDRMADNSPVADARIELEVGGQTYKAVKQGADTFVVTLPAAPQPGVLPITATVMAGVDTDLLAGELDLHETAHAAEPAAAFAWSTVTAWVLGGAVLLAGLIALAVRARRSRSLRDLQVRGVA